MYKAWGKRALDILLALALLLPALFVVGVSAAAVKLDSSGPAFFSQWRVGKNHVLVKVYKLRTMQHGAASLSKLLLDAGDVFFDRENDPRITRAGRVLRKLSVDELPQLLNIIKGEMSFVGPRPLILAESNKLPAWSLVRLDVTPGITGLAQVESRESKDVAQRAALDVKYAYEHCFALDVKIALRTVGAMLSGGRRG